MLNAWITGSGSDDPLLINVPGTPYFRVPAAICCPVNPVYARHGRELMGLKSPVSVPCNVVKRNINY